MKKDHSHLQLVFSPSECAKLPGIACSNLDPVTQQLARRMIVFLVIFAVSASWVAFTVSFLLQTVNLDSDDVKHHLRFPSNMEHIRQLKEFISASQSGQPILLFVAFISIYLFVRAFMIPGSLVLNLLAGSLYPWPLAVIMVVLTSLLGDLLNYGISKLLLRKLLHYWCPAQVQAFSAKVASHREDLLLYLVFIRALAFIPGWFINLLCPVAGVQLRPFLISTALGLLPQHVITVNAGGALAQLRTSRDIFTNGTIASLALCALLPVGTLAAKNYLLKRRKDLSLPV